MLKRSVLGITTRLPKEKFPGGTTAWRVAHQKGLLTQLILDFINGHGPARCHFIADFYKLDYRVVSRRCRTMVETGYIVGWKAPSLDRTLIYGLPGQEPGAVAQATHDDGLSRAA
jgi:hypothetical protein